MAAAKVDHKQIKALLQELVKPAQNVDSEIRRGIADIGHAPGEAMLAVKDAFAAIRAFNSHPAIKKIQTLYTNAKRSV